MTESAARRFTLPQPPLLSRATFDRADEIRDDSAALLAGWPSARVLLVDSTGRYPVADDGTLHWVDAQTLGAEPGPDAVFLGDSGGHVWARRVDHIDGPTADPRRGAELLGADDYTTRWRDVLTDHYGLAFSAARRLAGVLTVPQAVPALGRPGMRSARLMSMVVRVMGNLITPDDADLVARAWRTAGRLSSRVDDRPPFR